MSAPSMISGRKRAVDGELLEGEGGAQVGEAAERGANLQQAGFGALVGRQGIELVAADGAEQDGVGVESAAARVSAGRGVPSCDDGDAADALVRRARGCGRRVARLP